MMKPAVIKSFLFALFAALSTMLSAEIQSSQWQYESVSQSIPGRNGQFVGVVGSDLVIGGGYASTVSAEFYSDRIYRIEKHSKGYQVDSTQVLPHRVAYASFGATSKGLIVAGGENESGHLSSVFLITTTGVERLADLPVSITRAAYGVLNDRIVVAGGIQDGKLSNRVWSYRLTDRKKSWDSLPDFPGNSLSLMASTVQNDGQESCFYLFSDRTYSYSFSRNKWDDCGAIMVDDESLNLSCFTAEAIGTHHIIIPNHSGKVLTYHTITRKWATPMESDYEMSDYTVSAEWNGKVWMVGKDVVSVEIHATPDFGVVNYSVLIGYLVVMIGVGFYFSRKVKSSDNFFKGGGKIPWWAAGISIFAATLSAITFMAIPAKSYTANWLYFPMSFSILLVAPVIIRWYLPFFRGLKLTSAYEYLQVRFNKSVRLLSSAFFIVFMIARIAIVLYLPAVALATVTGMDIFLCIGLMSIVTLIYATLGGVEAVVWGDVIQGVILVGGALLSALYIVFNTGGLGETIRIASEANKFEVLDFAFDFSQPTFWVIFFGAGIANSLITYSSDQTIIQKYLTTADEKKAAKSLWLNGLLALPVLVVFYFIGSALFSYYSTAPELLPITMSNAEGIFPFFIVNELPAGLAGLLIAAIFAATMSTLSSNINSASTALTVDFIRLFNPSISDLGQVKSARISGVVVCVLGTWIAVLLSTMDVKSFFDEFNTFIGLLTSGLGGLFAIGIFMPRVKGYAALTGFLVSIASLLYIKYAGVAINFMMFGFVGIAISMSVAYVISLLFKEKNKDLTGLCWKYRKR